MTGVRKREKSAPHIKGVFLTSSWKGENFARLFLFYRRIITAKNLHIPHNLEDKMVNFFF